jgi:iron complex outermembrane receptor protein
MNLKKLVLLFGTISLFSTFSFVQAQEDDDDGADVLETIVVTATRRETDIMDTPIPVSALSDADLTKNGLNNIDDLSYALPGLSIQNTDGNSPIITLRGVRSNNVTELGDPAIGIHVDGVYAARPQAAAALMFDLERAELLRGPQGTLFGRNSIVGSLNIVTAKPNFDVVGGRFGVDAGRFNERVIRGHYNMPISDNFAIRIAFSDVQKDSYLDGYWDGSQGGDYRYLPEEISSQFQPTDDRTTSSDYAWFWGCQSYQALSDSNTLSSGYRVDEAGNGNCYYEPEYQFGQPRTKVAADPSTFYNNANNSAFRVSALWAGDSSDLLFSAESFRDDSAGWTNLLSCELMADRTGVTFAQDGSPANTCTEWIGTENRYTAYANVPGVNDLSIDTARIVYNRDFGDTQIGIKYGFQSLVHSSQFDLDMGINNAWDMVWAIDRLGSTSHVFDAQITHTADTFSYVAGAFAMKESNDMRAYYHATFAGDDIYIQPDRTNDTKAIFGQGTFQLSDRAFLTVGGRYTEETKADVGGNNYRCTVFNSCYPSDQLWWHRMDWLNTTTGINSVTPTFHMDNMLTGEKGSTLGCEVFDGPVYDGSVANPGPYFGGTGCMEIVTRNDVSSSFDFFDWRVGLDYDITDNGFLYGYVATGHKSGSIQDVYRRGENTLHPEGPGSIFNTSYGPEEAITYEFGYKQRFWDNRGNIALNYYITDYDGKQFSGNVPVDVVTAQEYDVDLQQLVEVEQVVTMWATQNFGKQRMSGLELEFDLIPYDGARLSGWVTSMKTEITEDFITNLTYGPDYLFGRGYDDAVSNEWYNLINLKGNEVPYAPDLALTIRYEHTFNLGSLGSLVPSIDYHWQSEDYLSVFNLDKHIDDAGGCGTGLGDAFVDTPGFFCNSIDTVTDKRDAWSNVNLFLTYNPPGDANWYAQAYIYNATDEEIVYWRGVEAGQPRGAYSAPSQWGVRVEYFW